MADDVIDAIYQADHPTDLRPFCTDGDAFGPCPCFSIDQPGFRAEGQCWRTEFTGFDNWDPNPCNHGGCCVHVRTYDTLAAIHLKHLLDEMDWYGEWALVLGDYGK